VPGAGGLGGSLPHCGNNPYNGDKNIYGDPFSITDYAYVGGELCFVLCGSITYQDGTVQASVGGLGFGGFGKVIGADAYKPDKSALWSFGACASLDFGGCVQGTRNSSGNIRYGGGATVGEGAFAGLMVTPVTWDFNDQEFQLLGWKWRY
jgi:hypothetical protein